MGNSLANHGIVPPTLTDKSYAPPTGKSTKSTPGSSGLPAAGRRRRQDRKRGSEGRGSRRGSTFKQLIPQSQVELGT